MRGLHLTWGKQWVRLAPTRKHTPPANTARIAGHLDSMKSPVEKLIVKLYEEGADVGCWVDKLPVRIAQVHRHFWVYKLTKSFETIASILVRGTRCRLAAAQRLREPFCGLWQWDQV